MFADVHAAPVITPDQLDQYLAIGWFRMRQSVFTTNFLCFNNQFYSAIWLRSRLSESIFDSTFRQLKKKNSSFSVRIKKASINRQQEALYKKYKSSINFQTSDNLHQLLFGFETQNRFDTHEVNVYDGATLIACGYFDVGYCSAAGIVSFYHPDYKKYSLGKYLIYCKMEYCYQQQLQYFYPGYVAPGYPLFDYKLSIARSTLEYFHLPTKSWQPYHAESFATTPLQTMCNRLILLQQQLQAQGVASTILFYRYFDANLDSYFAGYPLLDYPVFLYYYFATPEAVMRVIVFNLQTGNYQLIECSSISQMEFYDSSTAIFSNELLQIDEMMVATQHADDLLDYI